MTRRCGAVLLALTTGCGFGDYQECAPISSDRLALLPERLSETGLFDDMEEETLAPGVGSFAPAFQLWTDGAVKRRWILLPEGEVIDTSDMDAWRFPVGTKVWKEFSRDGVRVETRLLEKVGPSESDWVPLAYVWDASRGDAFATPAGAGNAAGTPHDVPAADQCMGCHGGTRARVLGFSAVQLAEAGDQDELDLEELVRLDLLSDPPAEMPVVPGNEQERAALGYLHANCSHCHNQERPESSGPRCYDPQRRFDFTLRTGDLASVDRTATYRTAIDEVIEPGEPRHSRLIRRVEDRSTGSGGPSMPPLGTEEVDEQAVALLRAWIEAL